MTGRDDKNEEKEEEIMNRLNHNMIGTVCNAILP